MNLTASMYQAAYPTMMLSRNGGSEFALGMVNTTIGITTLIGSIFATLFKEPKSRVKVICNTLLFAMSFENFLLAFGRSTPIWCLGGFLGWITIPIGYFAGGILVDNVFEPFMSRVNADSIFITLFGS